MNSELAAGGLCNAGGKFHGRTFYASISGEPPDANDGESIRAACACAFAGHDRLGIHLEVGVADHGGDCAVLFVRDVKIARRATGGLVRIALRRLIWHFL